MCPPTRSITTRRRNKNQNLYYCYSELTSQNIKISNYISFYTTSIVPTHLERVVVYLEDLVLGRS
jgi:hypothetical protein